MRPRPCLNWLELLSTGTRELRSSCALRNFAVGSERAGIFQQRAPFAHGSSAVALVLDLIRADVCVLLGIDQHRGTDTDFIAGFLFALLDPLAIHIYRVIGLPSAQ